MAKIAKVDTRYGREHSEQEGGVGMASSSGFGWIHG